MSYSILFSPLKILLALMVSVLLMQACGSDKMSPETFHQAEHLSSVSDQHIMISTEVDTFDIEIEKIFKTEEEWKEQLTPAEYRILRNQGTEIPFVNEYWDNKKTGIYYCKACGLPLFHSDTKYKSGTGWPSFWEPIDKRVVEEREDNSYFMTRTEIVCARCGSHIGHVFDDGPEPTGLRYCMNSTALQFEKTETSNTQNEMDND